MTLPLVLLPGMMCDGRLFAPQMAALGTRAVQVSSVTNHDSVQALAAEVLEHAPPRFALAGLSMGGIVAMEVLRQAPDRVDRLALLDTNPCAEAPEVQANRRPQVQRARQNGVASVMRDELKPNYLAPGAGRAAILDLCMEMALGLGVEVFERQSIALRDRPDQQGTLRGFKGSALVLMGEHDRLCPLDRHALMHALMPQSTLVIVPDAGHLSTLENPEQTTAAMLRWLEE